LLRKKKRFKGKDRESVKRKAFFGKAVVCRITFQKKKTKKRQSATPYMARPNLTSSEGGGGLGGETGRLDEDVGM